MEAYSLFRLFEEGLLAHKCEEEDILFPLFRKRARGRGIADLDILTEEHQNAVEWLTCLKTGLYRLTSLADPMEVVALLDNEARFKLFMNHHMIREERSFYPALEKLTSEEERSFLCRLLTFSLDSLDREDGALSGQPLEEKDGR